MHIATIARLVGLGYRVYMRDRGDSWLYYTTADGGKIGCLATERFGGYHVTSVHIPNTTTGTGALMRECRDDPTTEDLESGFGEPDWFDSRDRAATKKFRDWEHFHSFDSWHASYKEVLLWKRCAESRYWEMLGVVPPAIVGDGAFMVGEPVNHDAQGHLRFDGFKQEGEQFFETTEPMTIEVFRNLHPKLKEQR